MQYKMPCMCIFIVLSVLLPEVCCIISGIKAPQSEFPSVVLVKFNDSFYCGGSIILPQYILTSGVCGYNKDRIDGIGIHFEDLFVPGTGKLIPLSDVIVHPGFKMGNATAIHDIAIIRLRDALEFSPILTAAAIYNQMPKKDMFCKAAGWGMVNAKILTDVKVDKPWPDENILRKCGEVIVDISDCQKLIVIQDAVKLSADTHLCAKGLEKSQGPSLGDFGGPLICEGQQAGIATHSLYNKATKFLYTVYTPIYIHMAWIRYVVGNSDEEQDEEAAIYDPEPRTDPNYVPGRGGGKEPPLYRGCAHRTLVNYPIITAVLISINVITHTCYN